jgi:hypothetical protein
MDGNASRVDKANPRGVPVKPGRAVFAEAGLATSFPARGPMPTTRTHQCSLRWSMGAAAQSAFCPESIGVNQSTNV